MNLPKGGKKKETIGFHFPGNYQNTQAIILTRQKYSKYTVDYILYNPQNLSFESFLW